MDPLLELLELLLELDDELDDDDAICAHRSRSLRTNAARYSLCAHCSCCGRPLRRQEALRQLIQMASWINYSRIACSTRQAKPFLGRAAA